jgi:hypothetical protein
VTPVVVPGITAAEERPLTDRPAQANWSENYCLQAFDPGTGIGVWLHSGLPVYDLDLWHDITVIYLPGGTELMLAKGYALAQGGVDVPGSMLRGDYEADTGEWVWTFQGAAIRSDRRELETAPLSDRPTEPLRFSLRYRGLAQVWDLTTRMAGRSAFSHAHWEQPCSVEGWIEYDGNRQDFHGSGIRDHSRGPRDFGNLGPHYWLSGQFPTGRAFGVVHVEPTPVHPHALSAAFIAEDGVLSDANLLTVPRSKDSDGVIDVVIEGSRGEEHTPVSCSTTCLSR